MQQPVNMKHRTVRLCTHKAASWRAVGLTAFVRPLQVLKETYLTDIPVYRPNWPVPGPGKHGGAHSTHHDGQATVLATSLGPAQRAERAASVLTGMHTSLC